MAWGRSLRRISQGGNDGRASEELAKEVDLSPQLIVWNWLINFLAAARFGIVFVICAAVERAMRRASPSRPVAPPNPRRVPELRSPFAQ